MGANGAGHSPWSELVTVTMPGRPEAPPQAAAAAAAEPSEAPKRRRKKAGGADRELVQADPKRSEWLIPTSLDTVIALPVEPARSGTDSPAQHQ